MLYSEADEDLQALYIETNDGESFSEWFDGGFDPDNWDEEADPWVGVIAGDWDADDDDLDDGW